jgi:hypothetical protein
VLKLTQDMVLGRCPESRTVHFGGRGWVPHCPDFLRRLVALTHSMRLSLMKGAHADLSSTAWQEIGVKPGFGLSGMPQHSTRFFLHLAGPGVPWEETTCL